MQNHAKPRLESLGLVGDGGEVAAVEDVERAFGVSLDDNDAVGWRTAGDVYSSLRSALSPQQREAGDVWLRFARAISEETGVDPTRIGPETLLIGEGRSTWLAFAALIALVAAIAIVAQSR